MILIYTTVPTAADARKISRLLLEKQLAGCVVAVPASSTYRWQGGVTSGAERILLIKTQNHLAPVVEKELADNHPYEVPCILHIPISRANAGYLRWLDEAMTRRSTRTR